MIDLHYWPTPNGKKVTILLEECGLPYKVVPVNIGQGDQFTDAFLEMNPNHRMPVMVDNAPADGGKPLVVFESGAIMLYIAEKAGKFYPQDLRTKHEVNEWLIWQMANQGPKSGECGHFRRVDQAKEGDQKYAITRFTDEVNRLYGVLNNRLYKHKYLAGDQYTIADMICYPWTVNWKFQGQDIEEFLTSSAGLKSWARVPPSRRAWPSAPISRSIARSCRLKNRSASARCSTTSAPALFAWLSLPAA